MKNATKRGWKARKRLEEYLKRVRCRASCKC